jgi:hypothetical protein
MVPQNLCGFALHAVILPATHGTVGGAGRPGPRMGELADSAADATGLVGPGWAWKTAKETSTM